MKFSVGPLSVVYRPSQLVLVVLWLVLVVSPVAAVVAAAETTQTQPQKTMTTTNLKSNNNRKNSVCGILGSYCFHSASCCPGFKCVLDASLDGTCRPGNHPTANDSSSSSLSSSPKHTNNKIPSHLRSQDDDAFIPEQPEHYDESYNQNPNELLQVNSSESADSRGDAFSS